VGVTAVRLEDGASVLDLRAGGYRVARLDIGLPTVRAVTVPRPDQDGEDDTTTHHGAAAVSMDVRLLAGRDSGLVGIAPSPSLIDLRDALRAFCHPSARPYLVVEDEGRQRRIRLRADQLAGPITNPRHQQIQVSWRAPDGVMESLAEQIGTSDAVTAGEGGRTYPVTYPVSYTESSPVGAVTVTNNGTVSVRPVLRLYGPATDPRVENQSTGERLIFTGLTLLAGDWLEIDCREKTARLNGLVSQSRLSRLDFANSTYLRLLPGMNTVRYYPVSFGDGARLEVRFRSAWL
jgi:hypothetical protein